MKRKSCAWALGALVLAGSLLLLPAGITVAQDAIKQIALTAPQVEGFISAQKDMAALAEKMEAPSNGQPDAKVQAELESIAKKHGFKSFADYDDVAANVAMIMAGIDPDAKTFVPPQEMLQKQITELNADNTVPAADKAKMIEELNEALKTAQPVQHPGNIKLIEKYFDKLEAVLQ
jgi:hypothetical protein